MSNVSVKRNYLVFQIRYISKEELFEYLDKHFDDFIIGYDSSGDRLVGEIYSSKRVKITVLTPRFLKIEKTQGELLMDGSIDACFIRKIDSRCMVKGEKYKINEVVEEKNKENYKELLTITDEKVGRIRSNFLYLRFSTEQSVSKIVVKQHLLGLGVEQLLISQNADVVHCLVYNKVRFDCYSLKKFALNDSVPIGKAVKLENVEKIKELLVGFDKRYLSTGINMPVDSHLLSRTITNPSSLTAEEKENVQLRDENKRLRNKVKKLIDKKTTNITFNTIVNFNTLFDVKVNNLGNESLAHLTAKDKEQILQQPYEDQLAIKCIEKVHFNPLAKENNNVHMTNGRTETLVVRKDDKWNAEKDYHRTFKKLIDNVPRHIQTIIDNLEDEVEIPSQNHQLITRIVSDGIDPVYGDRVYKQLPDMTLTYTKSLTDVSNEE